VYRAVYKILVEMHESFQQLDNRVVENGRTLNDVDMIQARISDMAAKVPPHHAIAFHLHRFRVVSRMPALVSGVSAGR
jgi:hypothetical protein